MLFDVDDTLAMCDFQWAGKAAPSKDLAYCLVSSAASLTLVEEDTYLRFYHSELSRRLASRGVALVPTFEALHESYLPAVCDLARWMAGWSW
mmetsp:Transcript_72780/g.236383  ORF Transcript_72780/g.236383 Transcript_72780/m.236383 type:complete len:92 (-) Transcript_72780:150-425(-)